MSELAQQVFTRFVPKEAVPYCVQLYESNDFEFKVKKARKTKLGDFRFHPQSKKLIITINNDLNPYSFLITYLHEVAHLVTFNHYRHSVNPHGKEWKQAFKHVANPMLRPTVFPSEINQQVTSYLSNPKASSCSDPVLYELLKRYDADDEKVLLKYLQPGAEFDFHEKRYKYLEKKRTRIVCLQIESGRKYLINQIAEVTPLLD